MRKKRIIYTLGALVAMLSTGLFLLGFFAPDLTPLTRFFVIFFGAVVGFQCIPAVLLFSGLVRGVVFGKDAVVDHTTR